MTNEPRGCLAFLFGFGGRGRTTTGISSEPGPGEEGNYHSGPGGYEDGSYVGGYATDYRAEHAIFDEGDAYEAEEH